MECPLGAVFIETRGIYDGWSVAKLPDGTLVNRWESTESRYMPTQKWIEENQGLDHE